METSLGRSEKLNQLNKEKKEAVGSTLEYFTIDKRESYLQIAFTTDITLIFMFPTLICMVGSFL